MSRYLHWTVHLQGMTAQVWKKEDISEVIWSRAPGGCLLRIRQNDKVTINLHGFNTGDEARLKEEMSSFLDIELGAQEMDARGHNWGQLKVNGSSLAFEVRSHPFHRMVPDLN